MAKVTRVISDISGKEVKDNELVTVQLRFADARRGIVVLDAHEDDVQEMVSKGRRQARRGRLPGTRPAKEAQSGSRRKGALDEEPAETAAA